MLRNVRLIEELRASRQRLVAAQDEDVTGSNATSTTEPSSSSSRLPSRRGWRERSARRIRRGRRRSSSRWKASSPPPWRTCATWRAGSTLRCWPTRASRSRSRPRRVDRRFPSPSRPTASDGSRGRSRPRSTSVPRSPAERRQVRGRLDRDRRRVRRSGRAEVRSDGRRRRLRSRYGRIRNRAAGHPGSPRSGRRLARGSIGTGTRNRGRRSHPRRRSRRLSDLDRDRRRSVGRRVIRSAFRSGGSEMPVPPTRPSRRRLCVVTLVVALAASFSGRAGASSLRAADRSPHAGTHRAFLDTRTPVASSTDLAVATARGRASLGRSTLLQLDPSTGTPRFVGRLDGYLTRPSASPAASIAMGFVRSHLDAFGLTTADLRTFVLRTSYVDVDGIHHLSWIQVAHGLPAFDNGLEAAVTSDGRLVNVTGSPAHGLGARGLRRSGSRSEPSRRRSAHERAWARRRRRRAAIPPRSSCSTGAARTSRGRR